MKISNKRLGLLGGGQLGMYFSIAAKNMGYQITLLDPNKVVRLQSIQTYILHQILMMKKELTD